MTDQAYWNSYYAEQIQRKPVSQFGAFVASEFPGLDLVIDLGCGDGRDSFYFSDRGAKVLALDSSESAIAICNAQRALSFNKNAQFANTSITKSDCVDAVKNFMIQNQEIKSGLLYSRFVLHALTEAEEPGFLDNLAECASTFGLSLALEFRTLEDQNLVKETATHFRRFIDHENLKNELRKRSIKIDYCITGRGMAKFRNDDAHIARIIASAI